MPKLQLPLDTGYYESDSLPLASQNCINMYPNNPAAQGTLASGSLFRTPGIEELPSIGFGPGRGFHKFQKDETLFSVSGTQLYRQDSGFAAVLVGTISGTGRVSMADNGLVICIIVPDGNGYFYDISGGTLSQITDSGFLSFGQTTSVVLKNNRFVYSTDDEMYVGSDILVNNGKSFDPLAFDDAEISSDPNLRVMTIKNELYIFGSETTEVYQAYSDPTFQFLRIHGATIDKGLKSRFGVIEFDNSFLFLGNGKGEKPAIWLGGSGMATKVSTAAIDVAIQRYTDTELSSVFAWSYTQDGATFCGFTFPDETFIYDATASSLQQKPVWHQRESDGSRWRPNDVVTIFGNIVVSDYFDGRMGRLRRDVATEYGNTISRETTGIITMNDSISFKISSVELNATSGTSPVTGDERVIELQYSLNGGRSFSSAGTRSLGRAPDYLTRQIWRRIGRVPYSIMFRFKSDDLGLADYNRLDIQLTA